MLSELSCRAVRSSKRRVYTCRAYLVLLWATRYSHVELVELRRALYVGRHVTLDHVQP